MKRTAIGLFCLFVFGAAADDATEPNTYDIYVYHVDEAPSWSELSVMSSDGAPIAIIQIGQGGWTPEAGLPLNDRGDRLQWGTAESEMPSGAQLIASKDGIPDGHSVEVESGDPLQYMERRSDGRFELKTVGFRQGFKVAPQRLGQDMTRLWIEDRLGLGRTHLDGVNLDVGKPAAMNTALAVKTPVNEWGDCVMMRGREAGSGVLLIFLRLHGPSEFAGPVEEVAADAPPYISEQFSIEFKYTTVPLDDGFPNRFVTREEPKPLLGDGRVLDGIRLRQNGEIVRDISEALRLMEEDGADIELMSAPSVTTLSQRAHQARAEQYKKSTTLFKVVVPNNENAASTAFGGSSPVGSSMGQFFDMMRISPLLRTYLPESTNPGESKGGWNPGTAVIADFLSVSTPVEFFDPATGLVKTEDRFDFTGIACPLTVNPATDKPGWVELDFAAVYRYREDRSITPRDRYVTLKRTGPEYERVARDIPESPILESGFRMKLELEEGRETGFTFVAPGIGKRVIVVVKVERIEETGAKVFVRGAGKSGDGSDPHNRFLEQNETPQ